MLNLKFISMHVKVLFVIISFSGICFFVFTYSQRKTYVRIKDSIISDYSKNVELNVNKINETIALMENTAMNLALYGESFYNTYSRQNLRRNEIAMISYLNSVFDNFRDAIGLLLIISLLKKILFCSQ